MTVYSVPRHQRKQVVSRIRQALPKSRRRGAPAAPADIPPSAEVVPINPPGGQKATE